MKTSALPVPLSRVTSVSILMANLQDSSNRIRIGKPVCLLGNNWEDGVKDLTGARLLLSPSDLPRHRSSINDNYCVQSVTGSSRLRDRSHKGFCVECSERTVNRDWKGLFFKDKNSVTCILSCCFSCTFCRRVATKERRKSRASKINKICERCFLCKSIEFCSQCHKCPTCCSKSSCRVKIAQFLGKMGSPRRQPQSGFSPQRRVRPTLPVQTLSNTKSNNNKLLCRSPQEQLPAGGIASAVKQKCHRIGPKPTLPGLLQPVVPCTKAQQPVASHLGSEQFKQVSENTNFQNGNSRDFSDFSPDRGVGDLHRLQRRVLPCPNKQPIQEVHALSYSGPDLSIQSPTLWPFHSSHGVHSDSQRGQMASNERGYKSPPVPRRLVGQSHIPPGLSSAHSNPNISLQGIGLVGKRGEIRAGTQASFQFRRLPVRLERRQSPTHHRTLADSAKQNTGDSFKSSMPGPESNIPDRPTHGYRKASTFGQVTHEAHTVASEEQLESTRNSGESHSHSKITPHTLTVVAGGKQRNHRTTPTPFGTCVTNLYRRIKRRVGHSLKGAHDKGKLVTPRKQTAHKLPRVKSSPSGIKRIPSSLCKQSGSHSYRQHHCGSLYKQGRGNEVGPTVCSIMEDTDLVYQTSSNPQSSTYPRSSKC